MLRKNKEPYSSFYKILGFYPDNIHLYEQALLHKSSSVEVEKGKWLNNERMEFLGDAILDAIVADVVYTNFPNKREGFLTNTRSKIVSRETLNRVAIKLGLDKFIVYSIKLNNHNKCIYGNALEAFIAAIYLDQGYDVCKQFVCEKMIKNHLNIFDMAQKEVNFKSNLIEWSQKNKIDISFDLIESFTDQEGNPVFQTRVTISGEQAGVGIGYSKKESQQNAAKMAVKKLRTDKEFQKHVIDLKKHRTGENTETREFDDLPEDEHESDLQADTVPEREGPGEKETIDNELSLPEEDRAEKDGRIAALEEETDGKTEKASVLAPLVPDGGEDEPEVAAGVREERKVNPEEPLEVPANEEVHEVSPAPEAEIGPAPVEYGISVKDDSFEKKAIPETGKTEERTTTERPDTASGGSCEK